MSVPCVPGPQAHAPLARVTVLCACAEAAHADLLDDQELSIATSAARYLASLLPFYPLFFHLTPVCFSCRAFRPAERSHCAQTASPAHHAQTGSVYASTAERLREALAPPPPQTPPQASGGGGGGDGAGNGHPQQGSSAEVDVRYFPMAFVPLGAGVVANLSRVSSLSLCGACLLQKKDSK